MDQDIQRNSHCHWRNIHIYACMCGLYVVVNFHWSTAAKQGIGIEWFSYSLVCLFFYFETLQCLKQQWKVTNLWCSERKDHRYFLWNHKHIWNELKRLLKLFIWLERNVFPLLLFFLMWAETISTMFPYGLERWEVLPPHVLGIFETFQSSPVPEDSLCISPEIYTKPYITLNLKDCQGGSVLTCFWFRMNSLSHQ